MGRRDSAPVVKRRPVADVTMAPMNGKVGGCWLALALAVGACGGAGTPTQPLEPSQTDTQTDAPPLATRAGQATTPPGAGGGPLDNGNGWPVTVNVVISGQNYFDSIGSYSATGQARVCGNFLASLDPTSRVFTFEFPLDGQHNPRDVTFSADDLVAGSSTSTFSVAATVVAAAGHEPPAIVARPGGGDGSGEASLTDKDGTRTLVASATNDFGTTITLTAVCGPAPG